MMSDERVVLAAGWLARRCCHLSEKDDARGRHTISARRAKQQKSNKQEEEEEEEEEHDERSAASDR